MRRRLGRYSAIESMIMVNGNEQYVVSQGGPTPGLLLKFENLGIPTVDAKFLCILPDQNALKFAASSPYTARPEIRSVGSQMAALSNLIPLSVGTGGAPTERVCVDEVEVIDRRPSYAPRKHLNLAETLYLTIQ